MVGSIVIIVPELLPVPPVQGGAVEYWVGEASRRMASQGLKLAVVSRPSGVAGYDGISYIGIPWTATERLFHRMKERVSWKNPLRYIAKIQNVFSYGRRVAKAIRDFDVVYLHNEPNILLFINKRFGQKIVLHMHNDHLSSRLLRPFYRRALAKVDLILCVSDYIRCQAVMNFPEYTELFHVIFNSTDPETFKPYGDEAFCQLKGVVNLEPDKCYLLYVGRLTPVKGVHVLIEAFLDIHRQMSNVHLIITGSSFFEGAIKTAYEQELVELAAPVKDAIVFTGYLPHEKLKYLYSAVDMIVLPSVWQDPCPLVVLEAMAAGTCLVSSAVGGIPEILESRINGVLVKPNDASALVKAVCSVLIDKDWKHSMEVAARKKVVTGYTWERLVGELKGLFGTLK